MGNLFAYVADYIEEIIIGLFIFLATKMGKPKTAEKLEKIRDKKIKKRKKRSVKLIDKLEKNQEEIKKLEKEKEK